MSDVNKVILVGRLGRSPVQSETKSGYAVARFSLATSWRSKVEKDSDGQSPNEKTEWHNIVVWGRQAELCAQYLKKGQLVLIDGYVKTRSYEAKDGTTRQAFEIHAEKVKFLGGKPRATQADQPEVDEVENVANG